MTLTERPTLSITVSLMCALVTASFAAAPCEASSPDLRRETERAMADEPSVEEVQQAALRASGYDQGDMDRWSSRARWSHALPEVRGEAAWLDQRDLQARYREDLESTEQGSLFRDRADNDFYDDARLRSVYQVDLEWDLGGLVYDRSEVTIAREVRMRRRARSQLLEDVSEAYYQRRKYLMEWMLTPKEQWRERLDLRLEIEHHTALIDALTGGWYGRALEEANGEDRQ